MHNLHLCSLLRNYGLKLSFRANGNIQQLFFLVDYRYSTKKPIILAYWLKITRAFCNKEIDFFIATSVVLINIDILFKKYNVYDFVVVTSLKPPPSCQVEKSKRRTADLCYSGLYKLALRKSSVKSVSSCLRDPIYKNHLIVIIVEIKFRYFYNHDHLLACNMNMN